MFVRLGVFYSAGMIGDLRSILPIKLSVDNLLGVAYDGKIRVMCDHYNLAQPFGFIHHRHQKTYHRFIIQIFLRLVKYNWVSPFINEKIENQQKRTSLPGRQLFDWGILK